LKRGNHYVKVWIDDAVEQNDGNDKPEDKTGRRGDAETRRNSCGFAA